MNLTTNWYWKCMAGTQFQLLSITLSLCINPTLSFCSLAFLCLHCSPLTLLDLCSKQQEVYCMQILYNSFRSGWHPVVKTFQAIEAFMESLISYRLYACMKIYRFWSNRYAFSYTQWGELLSTRKENEAACQACETVGLYPSPLWIFHET